MLLVQCTKLGEVGVTFKGKVNRGEGGHDDKNDNKNSNIIIIS
jgi:hypothetical protein